MARIAIVTTRILFVDGGAECLAKGLCAALEQAGHQAEIVAIPFRPNPPEAIPDQMLACRMLDITASPAGNADIMIALKFPAYLAPHPTKIFWLVHQHRQAYDLWDHPLNDLIDSPEGAHIREAIYRADLNCFRSAKSFYTISQNVSKRLYEYCGTRSTELYSPPEGELDFYRAEAQDYLFFPSRLNATKRQDLVIEALSKTRNPVRVYFAGAGDNKNYSLHLKSTAEKYKVSHRIKWLGRLPSLHDAYACALGVVFPPIDEDYGYVTLEAMLSSKPVITCTDSGGALEFVRHGETGLCVQPTAIALAEAMDTIWEDRDVADVYGRAGRELYKSLDISWDNVVANLLR